MDSDEIKLRLTGYHPDFYRDDDPEIAEALRLAKADPELSAWLEKEIAFDREFAQALCAAEPPAGSREALLEKVSAQAAAKPRSVTRHQWMAAAAAIVLLAAGSVKFFLFPPAVEFAGSEVKTVSDFRDQMAYFANERFVLDKFHKEIADSKQWLATEGYPVFDEIPGKIVNFRGMGCKAIDWRGSKVGLVCFKNSEDDIVHLFVVDAKELEGGAIDHALERAAVVRGLETGGWRSGDKVLLLVGADPEVSLAGLL